MSLTPCFCTAVMMVPLRNGCQEPPASGDHCDLDDMENDTFTCGWNLQTENRYPHFTCSLLSVLMFLAMVVVVVSPAKMSRNTNLPRGCTA